MNIIAALIGGIAAGLVIGTLATLAAVFNRLNKLEEQLNQSISKRKVVQALNGSERTARELRQMRNASPRDLWNGALQAVWVQLREDLK